VRAFLMTLLPILRVPAVVVATVVIIAIRAMQIDAAISLLN
jgi:hypothetical protein